MTETSRRRAAVHGHRRRMPIWSSRSRMTPSRNAHGQISSSVRSKRSMTASATSAPATIWWDRLRGDPGQVAPARRASSATRRRAACRRARRASSTRRTSGPSADGGGTADPGQRAERLRGGDRVVGRDRPAAPTRRRGRCRPGSCGAARARRPVRRVAAVEPLAGQPAGAERERLRHVGLLVGPGRDLQRAAADVEHRQAPEDQPNQRRTARNVSRASSSPGSTSRSTPVSLRGRGRALLGVAGVADRRGGEGEHLLAALVLGHLHRSATKAVSASTPASVIAPSSSRCSASRSGSLWEYAGSGAAPPCASTTSRWPVLDPMSSTPSRMRLRLQRVGAGPDP